MFKKIAFISAAVLFLALFWLPKQSHALTVTPAIREMTVTPGQQKSAVIEVKNDALKTVNLTAEAVNFTAKGETGEPQYLTSAPTGIAAWTTVSPSTLTLELGQSAEVAVTFAPPASAAPGGYYAGILFNFTEPTAAQEGQLNIESKVGVPFLVTVEGTYKQSGVIATFSSDKTNYTQGPVKFSLRYQNTGDIHLKPVGTIEITNLFGKAVKTINVNTDKGAVLPGTFRKFAVDSWSDVGNAFGKYTAKLTLTSGTVTSTQSVSFWVLSTLGLAIAAVVVIILIVLIIVLARAAGRKKEEGSQ